MALLNPEMQDQGTDFDHAINPGSSSDDERQLGHHKDVESKERSSKRVKRVHDPNTNGENSMSSAYTGEVYRSNFFKLQVDDLLSTVRPNLSKTQDAIDELLQAARSILNSLPDRESISIVDAEKYMQSLENIAVPLPDGRASFNNQYMIHFRKPAHINVIGSYASRSITWSDDTLNLDLTVTMPDVILQEKDYLNYRYFTRRAYYLAYLASAFKADSSRRFRLSFDYLQGNTYLPVLVLEPFVNKDEPRSRVLSKCRITVLPIANQGVFDVQKLAPHKCCVRNNSSDAQDSEYVTSTPFYNASLLQDVLVVPYLKIQHEASRNCEHYRDACSLGRTWLRQRGLGSRIQNGGFGNSEFAILVALLLQGGGNKSKPLFSPGYSSYQLFKATLQYLSNRNLLKTPHVVGEKYEFKSSKDIEGPVLFDSSRGHNILYRMTSSSYHKLQYEAGITSRALNDSDTDPFEAAFILRNDLSSCRYDAVIEVPLQALLDATEARASKWTKTSTVIGRFHDVLSRALGSRVKLVDRTMPSVQPWPVDRAPKGFRQGQKQYFGVIFDEIQINRLVEHGPPADSKEAATRFVQFWGEKAELRRFRDGRILESVVWSVDAAGPTVFRQIVVYVLQKHFGPKLEASCKYMENNLHEILPGIELTSTDRTDFQSAVEGFQELETTMRSIEDVPLKVSQVLPADSQLSFTSIIVPGRQVSKQLSRPAEAVLELEGSARWPDDMEAIQRTKLAFLVQFANCFESNDEDAQCRVGLEGADSPYLNSGHLDIRNSKGVTYRLRIRHDRELALFERRLKDKTATSEQKLNVGKALAIHKQQFVRHPAHCQAIKALALRHPSFSHSARLVKWWFSSHLLSPFFAEPLIEMLVAKVYTSPYPWNAPSSPVPAFLRTILLLSRWDWHAEPWIVNLGNESMKEPELQAIQMRFEAWRKIDPAMNRVVLFAASNIDTDGTTWTDHGRPLKVVAARMTAIAKAAAAEIKELGVVMSLKTLFESSLSAYDFTIHLNRHGIRGSSSKHAKSNGHAFKNIEMQATDDFDNVGYDPFLSFVNEVQALYSNALVLFYSNEKRDVVAGLWNPQTRRSWKLRLGYSSVRTASVKDPSSHDGSDEQHAAALEDSDEIEVNRCAILNEIARLGGVMVVQIKQKQS